MTGSALFDFLISLVVLGLIAALFFVVIGRISPDETFARIARIAVGGVILVLALLAIKAVLFGGGGVFAMGPRGLLTFALGAIVVLLVLFIINLVLDKFGAMAGIADWTSVIKYVIAAIALIALLVLAGDALLGGGVGVTSGPLFGSTPRIMR